MPRAGLRQWLGLAVLMLPVLLVSVDNTVLTFALPAITEALMPTASQQLWMIDIYPLVLASLLVSMGSLGDRIGRRKLLLIGAIGFALVSILAAFATDTTQLILARAGLGVFGATLMPSTLSLLRSLFLHRDQRRLAIAVWAAGFGAGSALGPIVGGVLLEHFHWGSVFLVAVPVLIPLLIFGPILLVESKDPNPGRIDVVSIILALTTMAPIVFGIKAFAESGFAWLPVAAVLIGVASGVIFVRRQHTRPDPMLDMALFRIPSFSGAVLVNLLSVIAFVGGILFFTQHLQLVLGLPPVEAAYALIPGLIVMIIAGLAVVPVSNRVRPAIVIPVALCFSIAGYIVIGINGGDMTLTGMVLVFVLLGLGIGAAETVSNDLIISTAPVEKAGAASAVSETGYELGAVLGTATLGTVLTASYRANVVVPEGLTAVQHTAAAETLGGAVSVSRDLPADIGTQLLESARMAFDSGAGVTAWIGAAIIVAAAVIAGVSLRRVR